MKARSLLFAAGLCLMLPAMALAEEAHAAGHEEVGVIPTVTQGLISSVVALVVFILVLAVLGTQVWPKIASALQAREDKIRHSIEAAEEAQKQAKAQLEAYNKSLADARAEAQKLIETAKAQQVAAAAEIKARTEAEVAQLKERAMREIDGAKKQAISEVYQQGAMLATVVAGKVLQREVNSSDVNRLTQEAVAAMTRN